MNTKSGTSKDAADKLVRGIKRKTRKQYSTEGKIRVVLAGLRGEDSIAALCRREGIAESLYRLCSQPVQSLRAPCLPRVGTTSIHAKTYSAGQAG